MSFFNNEVHIIRDEIILFKGTALNNVYTIDLGAPNNFKCLVVSNETCWLWHRRLGHASMYLISKLVRLNLVRGVPRIKFEKDHICDACQHGTSLERVILVSPIRLPLNHLSLCTWIYLDPLRLLVWVE